MQGLTSDLDVDFSKILEARERLAPYLRPTPLIFSTPLSERVGKEVWLKLETQQPTGAFKVRAAFNGILNHLDACKESGVLTTSSGNYAQAVAYAAQLLGVKACIVMTQNTATVKVHRTQALGAEVVFCENRFESRFETLDRLVRERGGVVLHGFDSVETIAGNGTLALELLDSMQGDLTVVTPASGGGLISGIALGLKSSRPGSEVIGVQPAVGGAIRKSLDRGERVNVGSFQTLADALVASIPGERTFHMISKWVDGVELVEEKELRGAARFLFDEQKIVAEFGGAAGVAALLYGAVRCKHKQVVCVISGGNIELKRLVEE